MTGLYIGFSGVMLAALIAYGQLGAQVGYPGHVWLKMLCSTVFLAAGIMFAVFLLNNRQGTPDPAAFSRARTIALLLLGGLVLGWLGDLCLDLSALHGERWFLLGIFCFGLNHIAFLIALCFQTPPGWSDGLAFFLVIGVGLLFGNFVFRIHIPSQFFLPGVLYFCVITAMAVKACSFLWNQAAPSFGTDKGHWIFMIGALLFFVSDAVLVINKFSGTYRPVLDTVNGFTYFYGQLFCAFSISFLL